MRTAKKYLITVLIGFALAAYVMWLKGGFAPTDMETLLHNLCDAFFVPGVLLVCVGLLILSSNEGTFDGLVYAVKSFMDLFRKASEKKYDSYYDYKTQNAKRKAEFAFLVICGVFFIAVSVVMLYLNMRYR